MSEVNAAAASGVKHWGILTKPWVRKWALSAGERMKSVILESGDEKWRFEDLRSVESTEDGF